MIWDNLPHVLNILGPPTTGRDTGGGSALSWGTTRAANVPCLVQAPFDAAQDRFAAEQLVGTYQIAFNGTVTVERGDLLSVVSAGTVAAGTKLRVVGLRPQPGVGGIDSFLVAQAERVE